MILNYSSLIGEPLSAGQIGGELNQCNPSQIAFHDLKIGTY